MTDAITLALDKCEKAAIESGAHESYQIVRESFAELRAAIDALRVQPDHSEQHLEMVAAARAVVERWDTPLWKDAPATAGFINRLRDALPPAIGETME